MNANMFIYRDRTLALLRRYFRLSIETGRLPSLLGRECFRARVTSYRVQTFEDAVIFVHDVERCLERLNEPDQRLIARIALQQYTQEEAARVLGLPLRTVERRYPEALDRLSEIFLEVEILRPVPCMYEVETPSAKLPPKKPAVRVLACQEAENTVLPLTV